MRAVGQPGRGQRRHQHRIAQTAARLLDVGLIEVFHAPEFVESGRGGIKQFRQTLAGGLTPPFQNRQRRGTDQFHIAGDRHHVQPAHRGRQIMVGHRLALGPRAHRLVQVKPAIPHRVPQFVGQRVEPLVVQRLGVVDEHQVEIRARAHLPASQRSHRPQAHARLRHVECHRLARLIPQVTQARHRQIGSGLAFRRPIAVHAVPVGAAHLHEPLFQPVNRRSHRPSSLSFHFHVRVVRDQRPCVTRSLATRSEYTNPRMETGSHAGIHIISKRSRIRSRQNRFRRYARGSRNPAERPRPCRHQSCRCPRP